MFFIFPLLISINIILLSDSYYQWKEDIMNTELAKYYLPYEQCVVKMDKLEVGLQITSQQQCKNKTGEYPPKMLPWKNSSNLNPELFVACTIGYGHSGQGGISIRSAAAAPDGNYCAIRNISQRIGLRSTWVVNEMQTNNDPILSLFSMAKLHNIKHIMLVGDSITMQLGKFYGCDFSRTKEVDTIYNHLLLQHNNNMYQSAGFESNNTRIQISAIKIKIACTYDKARDKGCSTIKEKQNSVYCGMKKKLHDLGRSGTVDSPVVIIFNAGLHVFHDNKEWQVRSMVRAMLNFAKYSNGSSILLFRETSVQHFNARVGGCYDGNVSLSYKLGSLCYDKSDDMNLPYREDWRNKLFRQTFFEEDAQWQDYVGWVPFFNITLPLHDMHLESNIVQRADCTHYIYTPFIFKPLWHHINLELERQLILRNKFHEIDLAAVNNNKTTMYMNRLLTNGTILKGSSRAIYIVENRTRRIFNDWNRFVDLGFTTCDIDEISDSDLLKIPEGPPIT